MKLTKNFYLQEFVPEREFKLLSAKALNLIDFRIVQFAQSLRDFIGKPITVNNWDIGGSRQYSGWRPHDCPVGAQYSQHKYGRANDIVVEGMSGQELRSIVIKNYDKLFKPFITTIEDGTDTWLHADCRYTGLNTLLIVPFLA